MPRLLYTCSYDGKNYSGWQSQTGGHTIQDTLEAAFRDILKRPMRIAGAGRTDAGVHAYRQTFHADLPEDCRMNSTQWVAALNAHLPPDIRILEAKGVACDFHARFNACGKIYEYLISTQPVLTPFLAGRAWHCPKGGDMQLLSAALSRCEGRHDFRRFAARRGNEPDSPPEDFYTRTIYHAAMEQEEGRLILCFHGDGFMYRMVRLLVGTAWRVACRRLSLEQFSRMILQPEGEKTRFCAPASGLYLRDVLYSSEAREDTGLVEGGK